MRHCCRAVGTFHFTEFWRTEKHKIEIEASRVWCIVAGMAGKFPMAKYHFHMNNHFTFVACSIHTLFFMLCDCRCKHLQAARRVHPSRLRLYVRCSSRSCIRTHALHLSVVTRYTSIPWPMPKSKSNLIFIYI